MAGAQTPVSGFPTTAVLASSDLIGFVSGSTTKKITAGNFRSQLFGIAQADPLSIGSLTAVGNTTITGTLSGITTFTATTGFFTALTVSGIASLGSLSGITGATLASLTLNTTSGAATDNTAILLQRGGLTKWRFGTNISGLNNDTLEVWNESLATSVLKFTFATGAATFSAGAAFAGAVSTTQLTLTTAVSKIIPGATSISHRNNADSADNLLIVDNGNATFRAAVVVGTNISFTAAVAKILQGATSLAVRDNTDTTNLLLFDSNGITAGTRLITTASLSGQSGFRIPSGTAPASPVDGDMWYNGTNLFFRHGGTTQTITWT